MIYFLSRKKSLFKLSDKVQEISSLEEVAERLKNENYICLDTETTGLDFLKDTVIMLQLGTLSGDQYVIDARDVLIEALKPLIESKIIVGHNIKFDYNMLKRYKILLNNVYDTMLVEQILYNGKYSLFKNITEHRFSLSNTYKYYFKKTLRKEIREEFQNVKDKPFTLNQILYGAMDVVAPLKIMEQQLPLIKEWDLENCVRLENKVTLALGDIEYNGIRVNKNKWMSINKNYKTLAKNTLNELDNLLLSSGEKAKKYMVQGYQLDLFTGKPSHERLTTVNWNSDKQVYEILTEIFGIFPKDKSGKPSSSAKAIELLTERHKITDLLLRYREEEKAVNSFGEKFLKKYLGEDERIRTTFNQIIETGRVSSRNPNLQQIPSNSAFREAFEAPEGKMLSSSDYSSQEARIMADKAYDEDYIRMFNEGDGDIHSYVATKVFSTAFGREFIVTKTNENKEYRHKGKVINFFISFGGTGHTLSKTLKIPIEEADMLINSFYKGFPSLKKMFDENKKFALENGYIRTNDVTKRIRFFPKWKYYIDLKEKGIYNLTKEEWREFIGIKGAIERRAQNTPIQGTAGDVTKTALVLIRDELLKAGIMPYDLNAPVKIVNVIHDETVIEADEDKIEFWANVQKKCMEKAGSYYLKYTIMAATPSIAKHWSH